MYTLLNKNQIRSGMKVFCINGISFSGKDTFCNIVKVEYASRFNSYNYNAVRVISSIDPIKEIYKKFFGWNGEKSPSHRKNLNVLKNIWVDVCEGPSQWFKSELNNSKARDCRYLFVMVREFTEMEKMKKIAEEYGFQAFTLEVFRHGIPIPPIEQEFLDSHPDGYKYDIRVESVTTETYPVVYSLIESSVKFCNIFCE